LQLTEEGGAGADDYATGFVPCQPGKSTPFGIFIVCSKNIDIVTGKKSGDFHFLCPSTA
jgi:hypothetical protein